MTRSLLSVGFGFGAFITLGSYNKRSNNLVWYGKISGFLKTLQIQFICFVSATVFSLLLCIFAQQFCKCSRLLVWWDIRPIFLISLNHNQSYSKVWHHVMRRFILGKCQFFRVEKSVHIYGSPVSGANAQHLVDYPAFHGCFPYAE